MVPPTEDETLAEDKTTEAAEERAQRETPREELIQDIHSLKAAIDTLLVEKEALRKAALPPDEQNKLAASTILSREELETALENSHIENDRLRGKYEKPQTEDGYPVEFTKQGNVRTAHTKAEAQALAAEGWTRPTR